jgi:hypothetical protein
VDDESARSHRADEIPVAERDEPEIPKRHRAPGPPGDPGHAPSQRRGDRRNHSMEPFLVRRSLSCCGCGHHHQRHHEGTDRNVRCGSH